MVKVKKAYRYEPDYAVPPGETLKEVLESLGMKQRELADRTGLTVQSINRIANAEQCISAETANRLELATGVPARLWNNLEARYRERETKAEERRRLQQQLNWLDDIPVEELVNRGAVRECSDKAAQLREVLSFFGVSSVSAWRTVWERHPVAARKSKSFETCLGPTAAWLRLGELQARRTECEPFDENRFRKSLQQIRSLTVRTPEEFLPEMKALCAQAGVALVLVPGMPGTPWYGAVRWLTKDKVMILLSLRGKRDDQFWFSFYHEAGHVLLHGKKMLFVDDDGNEGPKEQEADSFAESYLIPPEYRERLRRLRSKLQIREFAKELGIAPGIVVGQYQYLTGKWDWFNDLKRKLTGSKPDQKAG
ncbi:MAG: helix-turn-helix domain-containing protein [Phycisphaerae bacterium]